MFIFVILANAVAALMACCGLIQMFYVISGAKQTDGALSFFTQLGQASLPLCVGLILYAFVLMCQFLEKLELQQGGEVRDEDFISPVKTILNKVKKESKKEDDVPFFGAAVVEPEQPQEKPKARVLPPLPELQIMEDPEEVDERTEKQEDDNEGMSFFRM